MPNVTPDEPKPRSSTSRSSLQKGRPRRIANAAMGNGHAANGAAKAKGGNGNGRAAAETLEERKLLDILVAMRKGHFTPRLRVKWGGEGGRIADTVNELMDVHERFVRELERLARLVGTEGRTSHRAAVTGL